MRRRMLAYAFMILAATLLLFTPALAAVLCLVNITSVESGGTSHTYLPLIATIDNDALVTYDYIDSDALDTSVVIGGSSVPHLVVDDKLLFVTDLGAYQTVVAQYHLDSTPVTYMPVIVGDGGYVTTTDAAALELGDTFEVEVDGYIETTVGVDKDILFKNSAFRLRVIPDLPSYKGYIGKIFKDTQQYSQWAGNTRLYSLGNNIFAALFNHTFDDLTIQTFSVTDEGELSAVIDTQNLDPDYGTLYEMFNVVGTNIWAVAYQGESNDGFMVTFSIDSSGDISSVIDSWEYDTSNAGHPYVAHVSGTVYAMVWYSKIGTFSISSDGTLPSLAHPDGFIDWKNISGGGFYTRYWIGRGNGNYFLITCLQSGDAYLKTWYVADNGSLASAHTDEDIFTSAVIYEFTVELSPGYFCTPVCRVGNDTLETYSVSSGGIFTEDIDSAVFATTSSDPVIIGNAIDDVRFVHFGSEIQTWDITDVGVITEPAIDTWDYTGGTNDTAIWVGNGTWLMSDESTGYLVAKTYGILTETGLMAEITGGSTVIAGDVFSGEHIVNVTADGSDLVISVDGLTYDSVSLGAVGVPDNANNYIWMRNEVASYLDYMTLDVSGSEVVKYQPISIISGTVLPDRTGTAQNGAFTWGSNVAGVAVSVGPVICSDPNETSLEGLTDPTQHFTGTTPGVLLTDTSENFPEYDGSGFFLGFMINDLMTQAGYPVQLAWMMLAFVLVVLAGVFTLYYFKWNGLAYLAVIVAIGYTTSIGVWPEWVLYVSVIAGFGILLLVAGMAQRA